MKNFSKFAVIGGSGAFLFLGGEFGKEIGARKIKTPFGVSSPVHFFETDNFSFAFLSRHGEKGYEIAASFVNYRANIWALKEIGAERIIAWTGPGIINTRFKVGDYLLPSDLIDETKGRKYTFFEKRGLGFIRQSPVFCIQLKSSAKEAMKTLKIPCHFKGVYICTEGPRLETPAEIRKFKLNGGDVVGMTLIPECFLARELEICYMPICYLTNFAEGVNKRNFKKGVLFEGMQREREREKVNNAQRKFPKIIKEIIKTAFSDERACRCKDSMLRYKKAGIIDKNWRSWIKVKNKI
ncbi:MAG: phosphorylase [Candidatus Schekmanbacteria bacterium RBG_16_38_11]|uniref:Phosphorylase n=1 Tax=Candidatus Schekmanbacteria bacterium RBG_16_38_11 TaxID=1817880 RepID=A0A1F7RZ94_9BACT|nr:MAG: phosphorylase [Candidatus Schekmanbacteria bacterium RBG_16_38_11]